MAHRLVGGGGNRQLSRFSNVSAPGKRRILYIEEGFDELEDAFYPTAKRRRAPPFKLDVHYCSGPPVQPEPEKLPEFWDLREGPTPPPHQMPNPTACAMERTASGLSISADTAERFASTELLEDDEAAQRVKDHMASFRRRNPDSKHERILRSIINPKSSAAEYAIDNEALESIFFAANEIFFNGRLSQRVTWDWSHSSSPQYDSSVIGTTALRRASKRGFETLIVLSSPILQDRKYSRRLLISTFLHELIHSYLFICCGFRARHCGGHTPGFHTIAKLVDDWAGPDSFLYLCKMEADLEHFLVGTGRERLLQERGRGGSPLPFSHHKQGVYPCSGIMDSHQLRHVSPGARGEEQQYDNDYNNDYNEHRDWWAGDRATTARPLPLSFLDEEDDFNNGLPQYVGNGSPKYVYRYDHHSPQRGEGDGGTASF